MASRETPLHAHEVLRASSPTELSRQAREVAGLECVSIAATANFRFRASRYQLPSGELWYVHTTEPVAFNSRGGPFLRVQIALGGSGTTFVQGRRVEIDSQRGCISPSTALLEHGPGFQQLVWRVRTEVLVRRLVTLTGAPVPRKLRFEPAIDLARPESKSFLAILHCLVTNIDHGAVLSAPFVLAELEGAMMTSLLFNFPHNHREALERDVLDAGSWQVKRVEEYIEAHLDAPFDIEEIARFTGISARSIYRAFKRSRGYSPMAFARQRRLQEARRLLETADENHSVTSVAFRCGFNDVGHFSREFSKAFGESPSAVRARGNRNSPARAPRRTGAEGG